MHWSSAPHSLTLRIRRTSALPTGQFPIANRIPSPGSCAASRDGACSAVPVLTHNPPPPRCSRGRSHGISDAPADWFEESRFWFCRDGAPSVLAFREQFMAAGETHARGGLARSMRCGYRRSRIRSRFTIRRAAARACSLEDLTEISLPTLLVRGCTEAQWPSQNSTSPGMNKAGAGARSSGGPFHGAKHEPLRFPYPGQTYRADLQS